MKIVKGKQNISNKSLSSNEAIFEIIFKTVYQRFLAFAMKFVERKEIAEDIIQEAFLKAWDNRETIQAETFQQYLFTLIRNACLNHIKHQNIEKKHSDYLKETAKEEGLYYADFFNDPLHKTIFQEVQNKIDTAIEGLPEQTRNVFRMSRFEGLKNTEIADKLKISLRTVEKHNTKALKKMKEQFPDYYLYILVFCDIMNSLN